ncbi:MAG: phytoene/squalene synthase family protein, partial [Sideroxyarcus sp.]|nr:phytoene/squalene synthase family protein [Sideroxyarcus sp.]
RRGMQALYAFCRVMDDIVDEPWETVIKEKQLEFWRGQIHIASGGSSHHPLTMELAFLMHEFKVTPDELMTLLDGVAVDCHAFVPQTRSDLEKYCYGVASSVGLMCLRIFGVEPVGAARDAAIQLGYAFQCTNILRDVVTDAKNNRCYLPRQELQNAGLTPETLLDPKMAAQALVFMTQQCEITLGYFDRAWRTFPPAEHKKLFPARMKSRYYEAILNKISSDPIQVLRHPISLGLVKKVWLLITAGFSRR